MQGGFYQQKRLSPAGMVIVIALHGAALSALMMAKMDPPSDSGFNPTEVFNIPLPKTPPPPPPPQPKQQEIKQQHRSIIARIDPIIEIPRPPTSMEITRLELPQIPHSPPGRIDVLPPPTPPLPVRDPLRIEAKIDNGSPLQPPYPASAQREGAEGSVQVRVEIGPDGRVKAVAKVKASRDDFYAATERQALRYWRFKPATVDGKPIQSSKVMTVHFRIDDLG